VYSKLIGDVSHSPAYAQAAITVARMTETLSDKKVHPHELESLTYLVLVPEQRIGI